MKACGGGLLSKVQRRRPEAKITEVEICVAACVCFLYKLFQLLMTDKLHGRLFTDDMHGGEVTSGMLSPCMCPSLSMHV